MDEPGKPAASEDRRRARARWAGAVVIGVLSLAVRWPWLTAPGFTNDQRYFVQWSEITRSPSQWAPPGGLAEVYSPNPARPDRRWCNYPPLYIYILRGLATAYDRLAPSGHRLDATLALRVAGGETSDPARLAYAIFKMPAVLADAALGALLFVLLMGRGCGRSAWIVGCVYVLMPAVVHNSALWGQVDAIPTFLMVLSLELARRRRVVWMTVVATLALLTKAQAAVLAPAWIIVATGWIASKNLREVGAAVKQQARVALNQNRSNDRQETTASRGTVVIRALTLLTACMATLLVVLLPFRGVLDGVWQAYAGAAGYYPFTHLNGFSAWFLATPLDRPHLDARALTDWYALDSAPGFLGLSPRLWGLLGVGAVWCFVMVRLWRRRCDAGSLSWAARLLPLAFFTLSTQMHERYLFPAIALWAWAFAPTRRWWIGWIVLGLCVAINQMWAWPGPEGMPWAERLGEILHRPWLGVQPGIWCGVAAAGLFVATLIPERDPRPG